MVKKKLVSMLLLSSITTFLFGQNVDQSINVKDVERIEKALSADDMQGRKTGTAGIEKAERFIENEFRAIGLQTLPGNTSFRQSFVLVRSKLQSVKAVVGTEQVPGDNIFFVSADTSIRINEQSGYERMIVPAGANFNEEVEKAFSSKRNTVVLVDTTFARNFRRLAYSKRQFFKPSHNLIFILTSAKPGKLFIEATLQHALLPMANLVGLLPGRQKSNEFVVFGGHYDHLGIGREVNGDSIYNGANDDATGTTAVITLAKYFKRLHNNERTIIFVAFTAEEIGGYGSQYFSKEIKTDSVVAMFNLEMIGTESKWGKGSAYITGFDLSNFGDILQKNTDTTTFKFYPDPYLKENLFYRSDNASLARYGVPAHTISTSKMDMEPNYHKPSDEYLTLNIDNMVKVIAAIAKSAQGIIAGDYTPERIKTPLNRN